MVNKIFAKMFYRGIVRSMICLSLKAFTKLFLQFIIFEECLDSNPDSCHNKQARYQVRGGCRRRGKGDGKQNTLAQLVCMKQV
jgi:hypothetical protein